MNAEHTILNHYNLTNPYPTAWPAEKDESDASDEEKLVNGLSKAGLRRSKSRYSALERSGSDRRNLVPGSQRLRDGQENLVQKDEPDPLGGTDSVVRILRQRGLPVEEDQRLSDTCDILQHRYLLIKLREQISTLLYHILAQPLSIASPFQCIHAEFASGS